MTEPHGPVYLVGAGPGDPGLITRRGLELLRSCDVVLYDRLVDPSLLDEAPTHAERISVGKVPGGPRPAQAAIDRLIVEHAVEGKKVVRLKGGDPFVFGRGADEAQALAAAGIAFEIVPGVSSAVAVPAYAGIPLTHSGLSSSFAVITAHESAARPGAQERWSELARGATTLVLLMGVGALEETCRRLIDAGLTPDEPAAVIERGTTSDQRTIVGSVGSIAQLAIEAGIEPPAVTIVGPVVSLRDAIAWFETRPLIGVSVVVTRPHVQSKDLARALRAAGAGVIVAPTIAIEDPESWAELDRAVAELSKGAYDWVVFSSRNAVERVNGRVWESEGDARALAGTRIVAVGPGTVGALHSAGLRADLVPDDHSGAGIAAALGSGSGRILLPRPSDAPDALPGALRDGGWEVNEVEAYRTVIGPGLPHETVVAGDFDAVIFASGSAVRGFVELYGKADSLGSKVIICIGNSTAEAARELGFEVTVTAAEPTAQALVQALVTHRPK
ncbi:MAG TPA: uroporphyrinogen-III C-methyltransferase [Actinomycetota bacterium]|nr:uroporphyrinogen-III C-methyltransferase [Actinomycetota bacterium]